MDIFAVVIGVVIILGLAVANLRQDQEIKTLRRARDLLNDQVSAQQKHILQVMERNAQLRRRAKGSIPVQTNDEILHEKAYSWDDDKGRLVRQNVHYMFEGPWRGLVPEVWTRIVSWSYAIRVLLFGQPKPEPKIGLDYAKIAELENSTWILMSAEEIIEAINSDGELPSDNVGRPV